jgi:hypothetical protein
MVPLGGERLDEWKRRLIDIAGDEDVLEREPYGSDYPARADAIDAGYLRQISSSPDLICRWEAHAVVARPLPSTPRWLVKVEENEYYALYRPRPEACARRG